MLIIEHRKNTSSELVSVPRPHGVEVDVRSSQKRLYLSHDSFTAGEDFESWLGNFAHKFLVVNVKEENLESACRDLLTDAGVESYFFLDQASAQLIRSGLEGWRDGACRFSEFENPSSALVSLCDWVWVDTFLPGTKSFKTVHELKIRGLKVCLVSPELHGSERETEAREFAEQALGQDVLADAVCTKYPSMWKAGEGKSE